MCKKNKEYYNIISVCAPKNDVKTNISAFVNVYSIGDASKEICGGPHAQNTKDLHHVKIVKEESSSSGIRRIKAILD